MQINDIPYLGLRWRCATNHRYRSSANQKYYDVQFRWAKLGVDYLQHGRTDLLPRICYRREPGGNDDISLRVSCPDGKSRSSKMLS